MSKPITRYDTYHFRGPDGNRGIEDRYCIVATPPDGCPVPRMVVAALRYDYINPTIQILEGPTTVGMIKGIIKAVDWIQVIDDVPLGELFDTLVYIDWSTDDVGPVSSSLVAVRDRYRHEEAAVLSLSHSTTRTTDMRKRFFEFAFVNNLIIVPYNLLPYFATKVLGVDK